MSEEDKKTNEIKITDKHSLSYYELTNNPLIFEAGKEYECLIRKEDFILSY